MEKDEGSLGLQQATLAGGCFWCLEAVYDQLRGVTAVESGYMGGKTLNPSYDDICGGDTGHAEVVRITFDPKVVSFRELLEVFFVIHDPTTLNAQGVALQWAQVATALVQIGGIVGALSLSPLVDRFGPQYVLSAAFCSAALCIVALSLAGESVPLTLVCAFVLGIGTVGAQNCNNGIAAKFYPTEIRATGVGWALAVGRIGSILGPTVGGVLLSTQADIRTIFLVATVPPLVAAGAYLSMGRSPDLAPEAPED